MIDPNMFESGGQTIPQQNGEMILPSLKIISGEFIHKIEAGIKAFENYLISEFGPDVQFNYVG